MEILVIWLIFAILVGLWANSRGRSGIGFGAISFVGSPVLAGIILLVIKDLKKVAEEEAKKAADEAERERQRREEHERQLESIKVLAKGSAGAAVASISVADELTKLAKLRDGGVLTPEEFEAQKTAILARAARI